VGTQSALKGPCRVGRSSRGLASGTALEEGCVGGVSHRCGASWKPGTTTTNIGAILAVDVCGGHPMYCNEFSRRGRRKLQIIREAGWFAKEKVNVKQSTRFI
jgi:hypothetical protein